MKISINSVYIISALILSGMILFVSMARASLEIMAAGHNTEKVRVKPVEYLVKDSSGSSQMQIYKLPEVRTLPSSPFYGLKKVRDFLWINYTHDQIKKSKVVLLIADKKIAETMVLIGKNKNNLALDTSIEAIEKLKYAACLNSSIKTNSVETNQVQKQIISAGYTYIKVLDSMSQDKNIDVKKYQNTITDLKNWHEEQKRNTLEN